MRINEYITEGKFISKQQVIDYFVKRGKTAAQGASAWERGWRGPVDKKPKLSTKEPRTDWQHKWEKSVDEMIGPVGRTSTHSHNTYKPKPRRVEPVEPGVKVDIRREKPRDPEEFVYKKPTQSKESLGENFADGKGPGRPGDSQRHGIPKKATIAELEKASHAKGRKGQLARWQLNMRRGKSKAHEDLNIGLEEAWARDFAPLGEAKSKLSKEAQAAIPGASSVGVPSMDQGPSNYYHKYRVGIAMASSPDTGNVSSIGPTSDDMVTIGYTAADRDIADRAYKAMGFKKKKVTGDHSKEVDVNPVSPIAKSKRNKYGI